MAITKNPKEKLLTIEEVSNKLDCSKSKIYQLIWKKKIDFKKGKSKTKYLIPIEGVSKLKNLKVKRGKPPVGQKPTKKQLERLYVKEDKSIREIAKLIESTKDMVYRSLREHEIERREGNKRSKLRNFDKSFLKKEVKLKGITRAAKELNVNTSTLKRYIL